MKAPPNSADSKKNTAKRGSFLNATGDLLHALSLIGAAYLVSQGKTRRRKSMLETILKVKGKINEHTRQRAEELLAQIAETEAQQQQHQGDAETGASSPCKPCATRLCRPEQPNRKRPAKMQRMAMDNSAPTPLQTRKEMKLCCHNGLEMRSGCTMERHLHFAAVPMNDSNSARWLIANGANVNAKAKYDRTPLHYAAWLCNATETAALLLKNGAEVNAKTNNNVTPLHSAAYSNATETAASC